MGSEMCIRDRLSPGDCETWASAIALDWSQDSTVVAVSYRDRIQLWTMGNYHYYLKQTIFQNNESISEVPKIVCWHPDQPLRLSWQNVPNTASLEGSADSFALETRQYILEVNRGPCMTPYDLGLVAVIDGSK